MTSLQKSIKINLRKLIPPTVEREITTLIKKVDLNRLPHPAYNLSHLRVLTARDFNEVFSSGRNTAHWREHLSLLREWALPKMSGGVNPGDQRVIFYMVNHFKPKNVLEIGTHIGCSSVMIGLALKKNGMNSFVTVDIVDVKNQSGKRWEKFKSKYSPLEMMQKLGIDAKVQFVVDNSIDYLSGCNKKFDFVFLDGSHEATNVFREIPLALEVLDRDGIILLHDYFPHNRPLWKNNSVIPGPYLATEKIIGKNKNIKVIPLGKLPWTTKLNSYVTSLAVLTKES